MKKNGMAAFLRRKQYVIAGAVVALAAVGTTMLYSNNQEKERKQLEAELAEELGEETKQLAAEEETEAAQEASAVLLPDNTGKENAYALPSELDVPQGAVTEEINLAANEAGNPAENAAETAETLPAADVLHFSAEEGILWPLEGDVILDYSMDATVYFATLEQYKYNPAVIIQGAVNDKVYSVARGKVTDISNNEVTGCTVTVDLGDGYEAVYGQLKEVNFAEGDSVESGHVLGFVAEPTKYFSVEGSNLYFALRKDGVPVDPVEFFE